MARPSETPADLPRRRRAALVICHAANRENARGPAVKADTRKGGTTRTARHRRLLAVLTAAWALAGSAYAQESPPLDVQDEAPVAGGVDIPDSCLPALAVVIGMNAQHIADLETSSRKWGVVYREDFSLPTTPPYRGRLVCWKGGATIWFGRKLAPLDRGSSRKLEPGRSAPLQSK